MATADDVRAALSKVQQLQPDSIARREELGSLLHLEDAASLAKATIRFFGTIPPSALSELSESQLDAILRSLTLFMQQFSRALNFKVGQQNTLQERDDIIAQFNQLFVEAHNVLSPLIALMTFSRPTEDNAPDHWRDFIQEEEAAFRARTSKVLEEVRRLTGTKGSQVEADYFGLESKTHSDAAFWWLISVIVTSLAMLAFLVCALLVYKDPYFSPSSSFEAIQLSLSKTLIFATLAYSLFFCVRSYMSHVHNAVVNKHRQNALFVFRALVEATKSPAHQDIILTHASSCIFSPQDTGYTKAGSQTNITGMVEALPKVIHATQ